MRTPDEDLTTVVFRLFDAGEGGDPEEVAFFPEIPGDSRDPELMQSYMHIGQHGAASRGFYRETRYTPPWSCHDLREELERIGYRLDPKYRISYRMDQKRREEWRRLRCIALEKSHASQEPRAD